MPRTIPEWVGRTDDAMPPPSVRLRIFEKQHGCCYLCTVKLRPGHWDADHIIEIADGGENRESNMAPACRACHRSKSAENHSARAEGRRHRMKVAGIKSPRRPWPMTDKFKRMPGGKVVRRD